MIAKAALALGAALLALIGAELVLQLYVRAIADDRNLLRSRTGVQAEAPWTAYDKDLGWRNRPGVQLIDHFPTEPGDVRINAQGLRANRDFTPEPPAGRRRALALGDSFTFGFDVGNGLDWPARLEALDPQLEVLNLGVCAYGLDQTVLAYEQAAARFEHDLVVLGFLNWDVNRATHDFTASGYSRPLFRVRRGRLALTNIPVPPPRPPGSARFGSLMLARYWRTMLVNREVRRFIDRPATSQSWELGRLLLRRLKASAEAAGARLAVVDIPWFGHLETIDRPMLEFVPRLFAEEGIDYVDLHPLFRERIADEQLYITPQGGHCSPAGYALIAAQALDLIRRVPVQP